MILDAQLPMLRAVCLLSLTACVAAGCTQELPDTLCLSDSDCPVGLTCGVTGTGDRICLSEAADTGADADTSDTGADADTGDTGADADTGDTTGPEICINEQDDDNDGLVDCEDPDCFDRPACACGNGQIDEDEDCDRDAFDGDSCETLGFGGGELLCTENCELDVSDCAAPLPRLLQYDDWTDGERLNSETNLAGNDVALVCYETPSDDIEYLLIGVAFGLPSSGVVGGRSRTLELWVWEFEGNSLPTEFLYRRTFDFETSERELMVVTTTEDRVRVSGVFCLGMVHLGDSGPTLATDESGIARPEVQGLLRTSDGSNAFEPQPEVATGDWVLRASIAPVIR